MFVKPSRPVKKVFIHCSAYGNQDLIGTKFKEAVRRWHVIENGWSDIGYHGLIDCKGQFLLGRPYERVPSAQSPYNSLTLAFCLDGLYKNQFNNDQFKTLLELANQIDKAYNNNVTYHGHIEVANKACPVFDYKTVLGLDSSGKRVNKPILKIEEQEVVPKDDFIKSTRILSLTSRGSDVKWLQDRLKVYVDGVFGRETYNAVRKFQEEKGLAIDGIVGPITWEYLMK